MNIRYFYCLLLCALPYLAVADTLIVNTSLNYSIYLPNNWVLTEASASQHFFYDTTQKIACQLSIVRYVRNATDFPTANDWSRAHFIANKIVTENSVNPWGVVLYFDSTATSKQGNLWAPELFNMYFALDTAIGAWAEYLRYTASGDYGYELYAIGDTTEMFAHIDTCAAILRGIMLPSSTVPVRHLASGHGASHLAAVRGLPANPTCVFDVRGRQVPYNVAASIRLPTALFLANDRTRIPTLR